jgi:hypothetical protein
VIRTVANSDANRIAAPRCPSESLSGLSVRTSQTTSLATSHRKRCPEPTRPQPCRAVDFRCFGLDKQYKCGIITTREYRAPPTVIVSSNKSITYEKESESAACRPGLCGVSRGTALRIVTAGSPCLDVARYAERSSKNHVLHSSVEENSSTTAAVSYSSSLLKECSSNPRLFCKFQTPRKRRGGYTPFVPIRESPPGARRRNLLRTAGEYNEPR